MTVERVEEEESTREACLLREVGADSMVSLGRGLRKGLFPSRQSRIAMAAEERRDCMIAAIGPAYANRDVIHSTKIEKASLRHNVPYEARLSTTDTPHNLFFSSVGFDGGSPAKPSPSRLFGNARPNVLPEPTPTFSRPSQAKKRRCLLSNIIVA